MIYLDMDGFLAEYDYAIYTKKNPAWNDVGSHVFRDVKRDEFVYMIVDKLSEVMQNDLYILTSVCGLNAEIRNEQIIDKMNWTAKFYPQLNLCNFIACESDKRNVISKIKGFRLTKSDILIDDYKKNLFAWTEAGGTAIKYLNGINSVGCWPGTIIERPKGGVPLEIAADEAVEIILRAWYESSK